MNKSELKNLVFESLKELMDEGEAASIARIYAEDKDFAAGLTFDKKIEVVAQDIYKLRKHYPVQYIVGKAYFYDSYFKVSQDTLIPRSETEELVYWVIRHCSNKVLKILDIGTGSGCIPIILKKHLPNARITSVDVSVGALEVAAENAHHHKVEIEFMEMDFLDIKSTDKLGEFDVIVSNPPYIAESELGHMDQSAIQYEPKIALFPEGKDPLIFYKRIREFSQYHLNPSGQIFLELNEFHVQEIRSIFTTQDFENPQIKKDLQGKNRMARISKKAI